MMNETNCGPLLLLLLLAVTPRNSCANPMASHDGMMGGAPANMSSKDANPTKEEIANEIKEGANLLTRAMTWLKDNAPPSQFNESILDFRIKMNLLPTHLAVYREEIFAQLLISQDRIEHLRTLLSLAADTLKDYCDTLIAKYNENEIKLGTIKNSADKFVEYARYVNDILDQALATTIEINDKMSEAKAFLNDFSAVLDEKKNDLEAAQGVAEDSQHLQTDLDDKQYTNKVIILLCTFGLRFDCRLVKVITFTNQRMEDEACAVRKSHERNMDNEDKRKDGMELLNKIKPAHKSATTLINNVDKVKEYLAKETALITIWQGKLGGAILENTDISENDIKYNIDGIKRSLQILKQACVAYLNHNLPDTFKG